MKDEAKIVQYCMLLCIGDRGKESRYVRITTHDSISRHDLISHNDVEDRGAERHHQKRVLTHQSNRHSSQVYYK